MLKEELTKAMLGATYEGGVLSLDALEKNLLAISKKTGGEHKLSIDEFIQLVVMFKSEYAKLASD